MNTILVLTTSLVSRSVLDINFYAQKCKKSSWILNDQCPLPSHSHKHQQLQQRLQKFLTSSTARSTIFLHKNINLRQQLNDNLGYFHNFLTWLTASLAIKGTIFFILQVFTTHNSTVLLWKSDNILLPQPRPLSLQAGDSVA